MESILVQPPAGHNTPVSEGPKTGGKCCPFFPIWGPSGSAAGSEGKGGRTDRCRLQKQASHVDRIHLRRVQEAISR